MYTGKLVFSQAMDFLPQHTFRHLYSDEGPGLELDNTVYALDATTIELVRTISSCLNCPMPPIRG